MVRSGCRVTLALATLLVLTVAPGWSSDPVPPPERVLITNDNGIDDPKIIALARAFATDSEVWVVAPSEDQSGTGSTLTVTRTGELSVRPRDLGEGISAYSVDGLPADCVVLALIGLMRDAPPDLVVSGINGGSNLGAAWISSGTIGAVRVAALAGLPAIAVSGLDDDLPGAPAAAADWVVRLAVSRAVQDLRPGEYLTVSMPRTTPDQILGARWVGRAPILEMPRLERSEDGTVWRVVGFEKTGHIAPAESDQVAIDGGYVAVVPMRADEVDHDRLSRLRRNESDLPPWCEAQQE